MEYPASKPQPTRYWDWPAVLLLIAAIYVAATRLNATNWTEELNVVQTISLVGVIAGLALGKSTFSPAVVRIFAFVYGAFVIFWQMGLTLGRGVLWPERMISMGNRLLLILDQIFQQKPVTKAKGAKAGLSCGKCGSSVKKGAKFCAGCGAKL